MKECCKQNLILMEAVLTAGYDKDGHRIADGIRRVQQCTKCGAKHHILDVEPLNLTLETTM